MYWSESSRRNIFFRLFLDPPVTRVLLLATAATSVEKFHCMDLVILRSSISVISVFCMRRTGSTLVHHVTSPMMSSTDRDIAGGYQKSVKIQERRWHQNKHGVLEHLD
ncbi:hypothetical protein TNIN_382281 [Trichonephila inaurata madagascariensis]|uniref:Uncharacterized protein n=1 Tax=Trichonephila inaurata madagascariensis TaxID=2747483 RepID=A0A8X6X7M9_9ARAC|nr:hypothetical protein TNIN_382281 [Trichonephila inaurata madagascariensis]